MAEHDELSRRYRAASRDEPPGAIDAAILAASRRAVAKPSASRRWAAPLSIAAVLVLAFGVTLHMQQEKPGVESHDDVIISLAPSAPPAAQPEPAAKPAPEVRHAPVEREAPASPKPAKKALAQAKPDVAQSRLEEDTRAKVQSAQMPASPAPASEARVSGFRDEATAPSERKDLAKEMNANRAASVAASAAPPAIAPQAAPAPAPALAARMKREAFTAQAPAAAADAQTATDEPTRELDAIAKLRAEGRNDEADKALAEFRRKRPDYRIPETMWERVKPR